MLRVVQVHCVIDAQGRAPEQLLADWATVPLVAEAVAGAGAEVTVLLASRHAAELRRNGVTYRFVAEPRLREGHGAGIVPGRLAAEARRLAPHAIHFNGFAFPLHLRAICAAGEPVLVQDHADAPARRLRALRRWAAREVAGVAFTAAAQAERFRGELPEGVPVFVIPESSSRFTPGDRDAARHRTGIHGDPALLWVGRLDANKDPLTAIEAVRRAIPTLPDLRLWMVYGEADLLPAVEQRLRTDPELAARVHPLGRMPHGAMEDLYRAADLLVLASHREGSGYALIEALACGLAPVVSDIPPFRALTGHDAGNDGVGMLAPCGDSDAFAAAIVGLAGVPHERRRRAVLDHFARHLSPAAVGCKLVEAYRAMARE